MSESPESPPPLKILSWWNIESCLLPTHSCHYDASNVARDIKNFLERKGFLGDMELHAVAAKKDTIPMMIQNKFNDLTCGVNFHHLINQRKDDACYIEINRRIDLWAEKNPAPAVVMLISGDERFAKDLKKLKDKGYTIVLVHPREAGSEILTEVTPHTWFWEDIVGSN